MSTIKANTLTVKCGSTLTLGESGKTIAIATGASTTGMGRTGTVNWVTTKKTANFTAVSGEGYFCDTAASGAFTLTLPSSPSAGDIVGLKDYNGNFATANLTIGRGGSPINGGNASDPLIQDAGASILLVYVDSTQGWVATNDDSSTFTGKAFISATGGTVTESGNFKIHTFNSPGNFVVSQASGTAAENIVSYVVVAGGAAGGAHGGAGGGAGGFREFKGPADSYTASPLNGNPGGTSITVTAQTYPITVGAGGSAACNTKGGSGSASTFSTVTSAGGGGGGGGHPGPNYADGATGGYGGGGGCCTGKSGAAGNTPPVSPPQGNSGGNVTSPFRAGGGGGATAVGSPGPPSQGGAGGAGATTSITGSPVAYSGGGGGSKPGAPACGAGAGGTGGGGAGGQTSGALPPNGQGTTNRGGGGGGNHAGPPSTGGAGGSGVVIIRYKFQ